MWKKFVVAGTVGVALLGAGGVAVAATGGPSPSASPSPGTTAKAGSGRGEHGKDLRRALLHAVHGQVTTKTKDGYVTHDGIRGTVTAVAPASITVRAADGATETFAISGTTVVHTKADGKSKGKTGQIGAVRAGDSVRVLGTGTTTLTATHVLDRTR